MGDDIRAMDDEQSGHGAGKLNRSTFCEAVYKRINFISYGESYRRSSDGCRKGYIEAFVTLFELRFGTNKSNIDDMIKFNGFLIDQESNGYM